MNTLLWMLAIAAGLFALSVATRRLNAKMAVFGAICIALIVIALAVEAST